uniref:hypothetical protein n=1 Tax=Psychromonas hadalis TaxID=211669 RepID=UPI0004917BD2
MNIKKTKLAITLTGVLFLSLPMSQAFAHQDHCEIKETQLGETMKYIKSELRAYVKGFKKGDRQKMQKHLDELLKLSVMANKHTPAKIMMMKPDGMKNRASDDMSAMDHSSMKADDMSAMDHSSMKADDMSA